MQVYREQQMTSEIKGFYFRWFGLKGQNEEKNGNR